MEFGQLLRNEKFSLETGKLKSCGSFSNCKRALETKSWRDKGGSAAYDIMGPSCRTSFLVEATSLESPLTFMFWNFEPLLDLLALLGRTSYVDDPKHSGVNKLTICILPRLTADRVYENDTSGSYAHCTWHSVFMYFRDIVVNITVSFCKM